MDGCRSGWFLAIAAGLVGLCGANCVPRPKPIVYALPSQPTLEEVLRVVNANNSRIESFSANDAKLSGSGFPTLRANVAYQRPTCFRLRADFLGSPELDLGSNEGLFWFWAKRNQPPAVLYCRHDQFATSAARRMTPIEPRWLIEALGITELDPALPHQGPFPLSGGRFEIRTIRETPEGPATKVTVIDGIRGVVVEQRLFDPQGRLLASSVLTEHRQDPLTGLVMPGVVMIDCPPAQLSLKIDLGNVRVNRLQGDPAALWAMPAYQGSPAVDLCGPGVVPSG